MSSSGDTYCAVPTKELALAATQTIETMIAALKSPIGARKRLKVKTLFAVR